MSQFDEFLDILENGIVDIASDTISDFKNQAVDDAKNFIEDTKDDLARWTMLLAQRQINKEEFTFLVQSQKDLFDMHALKKAGLTLIQAQKFRDSVVELVASAATTTFL